MKVIDTYKFMGLDVLLFWFRAAVANQPHRYLFNVTISIDGDEHNLCCVDEDKDLYNRFIILLNDDERDERWKALARAITQKVIDKNAEFLEGIYHDRLQRNS